jgi:hypothetical protein
VLPTGDQIPPGGASGIPASRPRIPSAPIDEFLRLKLTSVRDDIDSSIKDFFFSPPSDRTAKRLVAKMGDLFKIIDEDYLPQATKGRRVTLERLRTALRLAAIGTGRLIGQRPSILEAAEIHEDLLNLRRILTDILEVYKSSDE